MHTTSTPTSINIFWPKQNRALKETMLVLGAVILLSIASQLSIPLQPIPLTFQSVTVLLIGMALGMRLGVYAILTYLVAGFLGMPIFANFFGGWHVLWDPSVGYLIGFLPAVALSGYLAQQGFANSILSSFMTALCGAVVIFVCGVTVLAQFIEWSKAIELGVLPFIVSEIIKLLALSLFIPRVWKHG